MEVDFTLNHGLSRRGNDSAASTTTIGELLANANYKAILKFGESVDAISGNVLPKVGAAGHSAVANPGQYSSHDVHDARKSVAFKYPDA